VLVRAEEETIYKGTKGTKVINSDWKEKDVLLDKIFKDMNASVRAINHELLLFCLVILGGNGCWEEPGL
jgi:hypothetical protein